ncbi:hypothetical protein [Streptomyces sp. NPDC088249]|uniref:hypothetical protein n=1 Tax=Streptomyces sp. NPDC088249 TaxID=3365843 RepID=UPI00380D4BC8
MEVVADVARCARVSPGVQFGDDDVDQPVGQLDPVVARLGFAALRTVADLDEFHGAVRRVADHQRRCGGVHGGVAAGVSPRRSQALLDLGAAVTDDDEFDAASGDDLHAGHTPIGAGPRSAHSPP